MRMKQRRKHFFTPGIALRFLIAGICIYLAVTFISVQMDIVSKRQQLENLTQQVQAQQAENQELQRIVEAGDEAAYMERMAREKLGYVRPDERVYIDMSGK